MKVLRKIPVFLHIPKNAGTYVLSINMNLFRFYCIEMGLNNEYNWNINLRRLHLIENNIHFATIFVYDPNKITNTNISFKQHNDPYVNIVEFGNFFKEIKKFKIFSIIIEPSILIHNFFKSKKIKSIFKTIKASPLYYTILREPLDRSYSMFNYISGNSSNHEETHKKIASKSFSEYLKSSQLEDSWIIRRLIGLSDTDIINEKDFKIACSILDKFEISDMDNIDNLINKVFSSCYGITKNIIPTSVLNKEVNKNASSKPILKLKLNKKTLLQFNERTKLDRKIYEKYITKNV